MRPFSPRPIRSLGPVAVGDWILKRYSICLGGESVDPADFEPAFEMACASLPSPDRNDRRPGVGFVIFHAGRGADYAVLGWWDRENEMPVRIFVREHAPAATWRKGLGDESFCVWDLQVIAFERDAYVQTLLADPPLGRDAYLDRVLEL